MKKTILHAIAGTVAMLIISSFWASTLISELFLTHADIVIVKHAIVQYGLVALIIMMAFLGASGFFLAKQKKGRLLESKKKRMPFLIFNAFFIMIPSALYLNSKAENGVFDYCFYTVQVIELIIGFIQLTLLGMNFRDGLRMTGRLQLFRNVASKIHQY